MRFVNVCPAPSWASHLNIWKLLKTCFKTVSAASRDGKPYLDIASYYKSRIAKAVDTWFAKFRDGAVSPPLDKIPIYRYSRLSDVIGPEIRN